MGTHHLITDFNKPRPSLDTARYPDSRKGKFISISRGSSPCTLIVATPANSTPLVLGYTSLVAAAAGKLSLFVCIDRHPAPVSKHAPLRADTLPPTIGAYGRPPHRQPGNIQPAHVPRRTDPALYTRQERRLLLNDTPRAIASPHPSPARPLCAAYTHASGSPFAAVVVLVLDARGSWTRASPLARCPFLLPAFSSLPHALILDAPVTLYPPQGVLTPSRAAASVPDARPPETIHHRRYALRAPSE
ncbi:hypothetical protein B0H17DRAFT_1218875 [Mycena rosella]|uniref:Uncharacterized protein n=1 Tax=Mycena rosella TaxID=1033263 RepID=A0AAD7BM57_MYCRO|nr:hypothetical protein B0H17DRAFT_1218875 [Mycena rosella]